MALLDTMQMKYLVAGMKVAPSQGSKADATSDICQDIASRGQMLFPQFRSLLQVHCCPEEKGRFLHSHVPFPQQLLLTCHICPAIVTILDAASLLPQERRCAAVQ